MSAVDPEQQALEQIGQVMASIDEHPAKRVLRILHIAAVRRTWNLSHYLIYRDDGGATVRSGPFAGMKYLTESAGSLLPPKLLGSYEAELHGVIERIIARGYATVVNIGCGEGYYAVGLAQRIPEARVFAFDGEVAAQDLCRRLAKENGVADRVTVWGECGIANLRELAHPGAVILCDCEGGEATLLDPAQVPGLAHCDILVELHDCFDPQLSGKVADRFAGSHDIERIEQGGRDPRLYPALRTLGQLDQMLAFYEGRPGPTPWAFMTARSPSP